MSYKVHNVEQGSDEWFELKSHYILSASHAQAIANAGKGLESLIWEELAKKYCSEPEVRFSNGHTERGDELEPFAREIYELQTGFKVNQIGFVTDEDISPRGGVSPDGGVEDQDGLVEIKCFDNTKHFKLIIENRSGDFKIEPKYQWQMQQQMLFTGKKWVDFLPYNPNYPDSLLIKRVEADKVMHEKLKVGLKIGEKIINEIETKYDRN